MEALSIRELAKKLGISERKITKELHDIELLWKISGN